MTKYFLAIALVLATLKGYCQAPNWIWAPTLSATGYERGTGIAKDAGNNIIITGNFTTTISFGAITLSNPGLYLTKYDPSGNVLWAIDIAGASPSPGSTSVAVDLNDDIYVIGTFTSSLTIGTTTLTSAGTYDMFLAKFNASGTPLWAVSGGGTGDDTPYGLAIDQSGSIYITGAFSSPTIAFGTSSFISNNPLSEDFILVKYSSAGSFLWGATAGCASSDFGHGVTTDTAGNVYVTGRFTTSIAFGSSVFTTSGSNSNTDVFIARYNSLGVLTWATSAGGTGTDLGVAIIAEQSGNIYVTGIFGINSSITFGNTVLTAATSSTFLVKYGPAGNVIWARALSGTTNSAAPGSLALDQMGNVYLIGEFAGQSLPVGPDTLINCNLANTNLWDIYVAKFNNLGIALWGKSAGSLFYDNGSGIVVDGSGRVNVTGYFTGDIMHFDSISVTNSGTIHVAEAYVAKLGLQCTVAPLQPSAIAGTHSACAGSAQVYSVMGDPNADSYIWTLPPGWTGSGTTNSISVLAGTTGGTVKVRAANSCGVSDSSVLAVTVVALPAPTITKSGSMLTTASGQGTYQWFKNGITIVGATANTYSALTAGSYYVEVTNSSGCKDTSNTITTTLGVHEVSEMSLNIYPSPVKELLVLELSEMNIRPGEGNYTIINSLGQQVSTGTISNKRTEINVSTIPSGFYAIRVQSVGMRVVRSFIK